MTDWIEHDGGPQPVGDDVWLAIIEVDDWTGEKVFDEKKASDIFWKYVARYRILNQHLIDAARKEGIRLGLKAAADALQAHDTRPGAWTLIVQGIRNLNPDTIAKEAQHD